MGDVLRRNNVRESGASDAPPMMFAHGFGCDQAMWRYVAPAFADHRRVLLFDHVGFGGSDLRAWSAERYSTLQAYADDVVEIVRELDLRDIVFVGHSVAAMIGILAAVAEPHRFAHLVLVGPSPRYIDDPDAGYVGGFSAADVEDLLETLDSNHLGWSAGMAPVIMGNPDRPELTEELTASFCRVDPRIISTFARATFLADNRADLKKVVTPCLVMQCRQDSIAPEVVGSFVDAELAHSELVHLDATGHCPNLSAPQETIDTIVAYLKRHETA